MQRQPGTNTVEVVDGDQAAAAAVSAHHSSVGLHDGNLYDRSASIRDSVNDVKFTLFLAICLVVLVIFLFLRNLSATVIPSIALPMSIVGTFAVMYVLNYTIDNLSLMALTLSVGFVVDDAIVMLENIVRHMEMGEGVMEAALQRLAGNRIHDPLHDAFARRRVHSGSVHGRNHRPAAARIFRGHHHGDSGFRIRFPDAYADAVQPLSCAAARAEARPDVHVARAFLRPAAETIRRLAAVGSAPSRVRYGNFRGDSLVITAWQFT